MKLAVRTVMSILIFTGIIAGLTAGLIGALDVPVAHAQALAQEREPAGSSSVAKAIVFNGLNAIEGSSSFSLKVNLYEPQAGQQEDGNSHRRRYEGLQFDAIELYNYVQVSPPTRFSISAKNDGFILFGDFKPASTYQVTLKKGLAAKSGAYLVADSVQEVRTGDLKPRFSFKSKARYLPGVMHGQLAWEAVNLSKVQFEIRQVYSQNLHQWLTSGEVSSEYVGDVIKTIKVPIKKQKNQPIAGSFSLSGFDTIGRGVFVVTASEPKKKNDNSGSRRQEASDDAVDESGEGSEEFSGYNPYGQRNYDTATVVVTNLTVIAKRGTQEVKVWVIGTKDLGPVKDAKVELLSLSNHRLDSCNVTGANAECLLKWKNADAQPYAIVVRSGHDITYLRFDDLAIANDAFHAGKRQYNGAAGGLDAYIYPERDLYRPGELVHISAMIRNREFSSVPKLPLRWTITNPKGKVVREAVSDTSEFGIAKLDFQSTPAGETGKYTIAVSSGNKTLHEIGIMIEEFVPERIGLKVTPAQELYTSNGGPLTAKFALNANYLFGPPVANGKFSIACSLVPAFSRIPNRPEYWTGIYSKETKQPMTLESTTGTLDAKGAAQGVCQWGGSGGSKLPEVYEMRAKAEVSESGSGRVTVKSGKAYVAGGSTLIGLKSEGSTGRTLKVRGGLFDFSGKVKDEKLQLKVQLFNIRENWYYSYSGYGDNWKVEEMVTPAGIEKTVDVSTGSFDFTIDVPQDGWGRWMVRAIDPRTGLTADLDAGYVGWYWYGDERGRGGRRAPEPSALKVEVSKSEASPGDTIEALINAPFKGRVLVAFETDKLLESRWVQVDKPGPVKVEMKLPNALPNVYLTALLFKDPVEADGKHFLPARAWGATSIQVIPAAHRLQVKVEHPEVSESRKSVSIEITNEQKIETEYSLAVVDEGILQMTNFSSPDPLKRFFEARAMGVTSLETMGWTVGGTTKGKTPGGDEGKGNGQKNMPVKLVSFWFPSVKSDATGKAVVKIDLPAFQGKLRVMAVASGKTRFGSSSGFMTVRDPLVLQPTLPRFLTQGDKFQFPVAVTNLSGKDVNVTVEVVTPSLVAITSKKQNIFIQNGQMKTVQFAAEVTGVVGNAHIEVTAVSAEGRLKSEDSFDLPVKPSGIEQSIRLSFGGKQEVPLSTVIPASWRTDHVQIDAAASNLPYLNELGHLEMLLNYPYGCIEQTTSATMPLLVMEDLLKWVDSKRASRADIKDMVKKGIQRVLSMQTASGGFGYWPGDGQASSWASGYATSMLLDAKKLGFEVPAQAIKNALDYLESNVRNANYRMTAASATHQEVPFALNVLAKGGRNVTQELRQTLQGVTVQTAAASKVSTPALRWNGLSGENYFLLAATAKMLGDAQSLKVLADETLFSAQLVGARDQEYTYWSPYRTDGLRLSVMQDVWPQHQALDTLAQRVAANLSRNGGFYYSTQDVAWSVLGLGKRIKGLKKASAPAMAKTMLVVNGKKMAKTFDFMGAPGFTIQGPNMMANKIQLADLPEESGIFLYVKATGYTKTPPVGKSTMEISRRFLDRSGQTVNTMAIKQGETLFVELTVKNKRAQSEPNIAIVDRLPAGFEIENPRLGRSEDLQWMSEAFKADYQDLRDDRIQVFGKLGSKAEERIYYSVRAVTKGRYTAPAAYAEAMYDPENYVYDKDLPVQIIDASGK